MVFCHSCGTRCDQPGAKFCFSCGTALVGSSPAALVAQPAPAPVQPKPAPAPQPVVVSQPVQPQAPKKSGRCQNSTKDKSTFAYVCYNCGYGSHAETDCVVCGTYMRSNKQDARLCMDCGWTTFPENCAHCNQPLGSTKIRGYACTDCTTGSNLYKCCKLRPGV